ncbi:MAG: PHP domain-containing protein [Deltaproteobacteria bacterium]|nr:PHP domain-containing protein [Deltaproteobacteria bacterium]
MLKQNYAKSDTHIHTSYSDGLNSPEEIVNAASGNLNVIAITDHNRIKGAYKAKEYAGKNRHLGVDVIIGEEISTKNGHVIGLFIKDKIIPGKTAQETIDEIHKQDGLAICPHPYYLISYKEKGNKPLRKLLGLLNFDAIEVINNSSIFAFFYNALSSLANASVGLPALGVSDAHSKEFIGKGFTKFEGKNAEDFKNTIIKNKVTAHFKNYSFKDINKQLLHSFKSFYYYYMNDINDK